jgi:acetyl-CoA acyltransferase
MVAGGGMTPFGRHSATSLVDLSGAAIVRAVAAARVARSDIEAAFVGNAFGGALLDQESILAQTLLTPAGICGIPMRTIKNACSSGADAVHLAWSAIAFGQYDCVLVLGAEKLTSEDRSKAFKALATATDHAPLADGRSVFIDINAERANAYMKTYGAQAEHFAKIAVKNRLHAGLNDRAAERKPITVEEVLADRPLVPPLTRAMCGGIADGAACVILVSEGFAAKRGLGKLSEIAASSVVSGVTGGRAEGSATHRAAMQAYESSGIDAGDVAVAEVHDPTSPQELFDIEDLLFCKRGEAIRLLEDGETSLGGRIPVNTSGGLTSRGHPVGATGVAQIVEIDEQLTGRAGARQVQGAKLGLAQMAGGLLGGDSAVASVHLLSV